MPLDPESETFVPSPARRKCLWIRTIRWTLVVTHIALVVPAVWLWLAVASPALHESPDANIGAGLVGLYLLALGLPWSLTVFLVDLNSLTDAMRDGFVAVLPLLSLILHFLWASKLQWRRGKTGA